MGEPEAHINKLPLWVLSKVMSYLNFRDRQTASLVSTSWYEAAQDPTLLRSTCISIESEEDRRDLLSGIARRGIQNLKIGFDEDLSPEITGCTELLDNVRYLHLDGDITDREVVSTIGHFRNLQTLKLDLLLCSFSGDEAQGAGALTEALNRVPNLVCQVPILGSEERINAMFPCFAGAENIEIVSSMPTHEYLFQLRERLHPIRAFIPVLRLPGMTSHLRVLDLRWCSMPRKFVRKLVAIPFVKLHTLRLSGKCGIELGLVADSRLNLTTLEVVYPSEVRMRILDYVVVEYLLTRKPSINCLELSGIEYQMDVPWKALDAISSKWTGIRDLEILGLDPLATEDTTLSFSILGGSRRLEVDTPSVIDVTAMSSLAEHSPGLRALMIQSPSAPEETTDYLGMSVMVDSFPHLTRLVLIECDLQHLDDNQAACWAPALSKLAQVETFCLGFSEGVTDTHLVGLHLPKVKRLMLPGGSELTDRAVDSIASSNPTLQSLDLSGCTRLTDEGIASVASHLKHLQCLHLIDCERITGKSAVALSEMCPMLQMVDASRCAGSFVDALESQRATLPYLGPIKMGTLVEEHRTAIIARTENYDTLSW